VKVLREGVYDERYIRKMMRPTILFICSGNTCRSPMAAAIARSLLKGPGDGRQSDEAAARVLSAGVAAESGAGASPQAVEAMTQQGLDLSAHRSRPLTLDLAREADVILCMTAAHRLAVLQVDPTAADKTRLLDPDGDIDDPFGAEGEVYRRCAELLRLKIERVLKEQQV
jgi:protein-tyrosine phosphatase